MPAVSHTVNGEGRLDSGASAARHRRPQGCDRHGLPVRHARERRPRGGCRRLGQIAGHPAQSPLGEVHRDALFGSQRHQSPGLDRRTGDQVHAPCLGERRQHQEPFHPRKPFAETLARTTAKGEIGIPGRASVGWGCASGGDEGVALRQRVQQCLGLLKISGVKALGEPAIDRGQEASGLGALVLLLP